MRCLALLAFVPALAIAGDWSTAAPAAKPGSFQAWATSVLAEHPAACPCGERCECDPCECPNCPHKAVAPPLVITVADSNCPPCERFKQDALVRLVRAGWVETQHYTLRVVPFGSEKAPSFAWHGVPFSEDGYFGWDDWRAELKVAMGEAYRGPANTGAQPTHDATPHDAGKAVAPVVRVERPATVMRADYHVHVCRRCGHSWSHHDSNSGSASAHRCANCGNYEYLIRSHSGPANNYSQPAYRQPTYRYQPTQQRGFFGRLFGGGCPSGNCP